MPSTDERNDTPRPGTHHPHLARERALKLLFQADVRGVDPRELLVKFDRQRGSLELLDELEPDEDQVARDEDLQVELTRRRRMPLDDYTRTLVEGVAQHKASIDALLGEVAERWAVRRMPAVDRNLLRLAIYELAEQDTPHAVVIDEAVSLAGGFAGEKARPFVNGILETVRQGVAKGEITLTPEMLEPVKAEREAPLSARIAPVAAPVEAAEDDESAEDEVDEGAGVAWDAALGLLDELDGSDDDEVALLDDEPVSEDAEPVVRREVQAGLFDFDDDDDSDEDEVFEGADQLDGDGLFKAFGADADSPVEDEDEALW